MKKLLLGFAVIAALAFSASPSNAVTYYDQLFQTSGYSSKSDTVASVPAGANLVVEVSDIQSGASAYASASGGGAYVSAYVTNDVVGASDEQVTSYAGSISYSLWVSGYAYSFVEIDW